MAKRNIHPRKGLWTLPAGFMENGETLEAGALRETMEETGSEAKAIMPCRLKGFLQLGSFVFHGNV